MMTKIILTIAIVSYLLVITLMFSVFRKKYKEHKELQARIKVKSRLRLIHGDKR